MRQRPASSLLPYVLAWCLMIPIAILNGVIREATYGKQLDERTSHQLSTASGIFLLGLLIGGVIRACPPRSSGHALRIGLLWVVLTVAFEFLFGHYVAGHSWADLRRDYNLRAGRLWPLLLLWVGLAPWFFHALRRR